jgi:magnesium-transporting ATPase (P-type)
LPDFQSSSRVIQEARTEHALEALRDLTSPRALVIRDGLRKRVAGRDVVRGDLVVLNEGDRVPADGRLAECDGLQVDESLLTGESVAVRKSACGQTAPSAKTRPGGDDLPFVYSGTLVVRGSGRCFVTATGPASEIGRIGQVLSTLETGAFCPRPFHRHYVERMRLKTVRSRGGVSLVQFGHSGLHMRLHFLFPDNGQDGPAARDLA